MAHFFGILCCFLTIDMRMAENEFVAQAIANVRYIEIIRLRRNLSVENDMKQHIA